MENVNPVLMIIVIAQSLIIAFMAFRTGNLIPFQFAVDLLKEVAKGTPNKWDDAAVGALDSTIKPRIPVTVPETGASVEVQVAGEAAG